MLKQFAWDTFSKTGDIEAYFLYREIEVKNSSSHSNNDAREEAAISS